MKTLSLIKTACTVLLLFVISLVNAQDKTDIVIMLSGEKKEGRVVSISDDAIKFIHKGETLEYELKKNQINKIDFASGRSEIINSTSTIAVTASTAEERKGKIAVLPFDYITNENASMSEKMGSEIQLDCYNSIKQNTIGLIPQDPLTTNSILAGKGIASTGIRLTPPREMAAILGVEYVVYGTANVTNKGSYTYGSGVTTYKDKEKKDGDDKKSSGTAYSSNNSSTMTDYDTKIDLNIYNDKGENVYSQSRNAFGSSPDAYHGTINYLIKRTPFGNKKK